MAEIIPIGTNDDGSTRQLVRGEHLVIVGPITGTVRLDGGKVVDVSPAVVEASSEAEAAQIAAAVSERYAAEGHPTDPNFEYIPDAEAQA